MLYLLVAAVFFFVACFGDVIITHTEIGVIEEFSQNQGQDDETSTSESTYQEGLLRRRLMPGGLVDTDKLTILNLHNQYRNMTAQGLTSSQPSAGNMNQMIWDAGLAKVAQNYSSQCIWAHNPNRSSQLKNYLNITSFDYVNQYVGENLFISTGSETIDTILTGIEYWYNEYQYFTFGTISGTGTCQSGQQCGHYTQLVWGNTRYVGCGYTKCATVQNLPTFTNAILFDCNYYFAGNYVDDYPYISAESCSNCPEDRQNCQDGLCSGCPSASWDTYCCEYCSSSTCSNAISNGWCNSPSSCSNGITSATQAPTTTTTTNAPTTTTTNAPTTSSPTLSPTTPPPTTGNPTKSPHTTKSPTHKSNCCLAYSSRYTADCKLLSSTTCQNTRKCYWDANC